MKIKKKVYVKWFVVVIFLGLFLSGWVISLVNYNYNKNQTFVYSSDGFLDYQYELDNVKFGVKTYKYGGCGAMATYNVLRLAGKTQEKIDILEITRYFDTIGENFWGLLGANPLMIMLYLNANGYKTNLCLDKSKFDSVAEESKACIILYVDFSGGHYQTLEYKEKDSDNKNVYTFYNPRKTDTMENFINKNGNNKMWIMLYLPK